MNDKKPNRLEPPLRITKETFINSSQEEITVKEKKIKSRAQTVTFTLYNLDTDILEQQLDRATLLNKRNKNKSVIIRMALRALENCSDEEYSVLYNEF
jgi:adenine-specific DNA glycosylase